MKALQILPDGYKEIFSVDLQKNVKLSILLNVFAALVAFAMVLVMHLYIPIFTLFDMHEDIGMYFVRMGVLVVAMISYMVLHELIHGITMKFFGTKRVKYGFTGMYAFAGSDDYYDKTSYIIIALAPVVFLGIVIALINVFVQAPWFWVVYFLQIINISGAAGDIYVTVKFSHFPPDILIKDSGVGMVVYAKQNT